MKNNIIFHFLKMSYTFVFNSETWCTVRQNGKFVVIYIAFIQCLYTCQYKIGGSILSKIVKELYDQYPQTPPYIALFKSRNSVYIKIVDVN